MAAMLRIAVYVLTFVSEVAVQIAIQKGWFNGVPDWLLLCCILAPILAFVCVAATHEAVRKRYHLLHENQTVSLLLFILTGAILGGAAWVLAMAATLVAQRNAGVKAEVAASARKEQPSKGLTWDTLFDELNARQRTQDKTDAYVSRTFFLLRDKGATISLGPCPSERCMEFELGELKKGEEGVFEQQIILNGDGFGIQIGSDAKYLLKMKSAVRLRGARLSIPFTGNEKVSAWLPLTHRASFDLFGPYADVKFSVVDLQADALKIKLEVRPPSGWRLDSSGPPPP